MDKLYHLDCKAITQEQIAIGSGSRVGNKVHLLHQQLGYRNEQQLKEMVSQDLAKRVKIPKFAGISSCKQCVEGKMSRKPFKSVREICSTRKLQQHVHSDVCGKNMVDHSQRSMWKMS